MLNETTIAEIYMRKPGLVEQCVVRRHPLRWHDVARMARLIALRILVVGKSKAAKRRSTKPYICRCGHHRADHQGMGPSRGRPILSACALCSCNQWRPSKKQTEKPCTN